MFSQSVHFIHYGYCFLIFIPCQWHILSEINKYNTYYQCVKLKKTHTDFHSLTYKKMYSHTFEIYCQIISHLYLKQTDIMLTACSNSEMPPANQPTCSILGPSCKLHNRLPRSLTRKCILNYWIRLEMLYGVGWRECTACGQWTRCTFPRQCLLGGDLAPSLDAKLATRLFVFIVPGEGAGGGGGKRWWCMAGIG